VWFPTSSRLLGGLAALLGLFAASATLSIRHLERMVKVTDEVREIQTALEAVLRVQNLARKQDAVQADLIVSENFDKLTEFDEASRAIKSDLAEISPFMTAAKEKAWLQQCREQEQTLNSLFQSEFLPALASGKTTRVQALRSACHDRVEAIIGLCARLRPALGSKIEEHVRRANDLRSAAVRYSGLLLAAAVIVAVVVALLAARSVVTPIRQLIEGTEAVSRGDLSRRLKLRRSDEFGRLAESFDRMTQELQENQRQLVQAEKMVSLGRLAAGVAHEIKNPIGVILGYVTLLRRDDGLSDNAEEGLQAIEEEARQCNRIVEDLLDLSRPVRPSDEPTDITEVVRDVLHRAEKQHAGDRIVVSCEMPDEALVVRGDRWKLRQAVENIVRNGIEAMPDGGALTVRAGRQHGPAGHSPVTAAAAEIPFVTLSFKDTGCGIRPEDVQKLFDPFFSTKSDGTGLGLSITYAIVRAHEGFVDVRSVEGKGTKFIVNLPAYRRTE